MATVIDALVVELGLDPSKFTKGLKEALEAAAKGKDALGEGGKEIEAGAKSMTETFSKLRDNVLGLAVLFTGGLGIKEFVKSVTNSDVAVGRLAQVTGESTHAISLWRNAGILAGGTGDSFTNILHTMTRGMAQLQRTGTSELIPVFRELGIDISKFNDASQLTLAVIQAIQDQRVDPARGELILQSFGADDAAISAILRGKDAIQEYLNQAQRVGTIMEGDDKIARNLANAWDELALSSTNAGRRILHDLAPSLTSILHWASEWYSVGSGSQRVNDVAHFLGLGDVVKIRGKLGGDSSIKFPEKAAGGAGEKGAAGVVGLSPGGGLRLKAGAGTASPGVAVLAAALQNEIPGLKRFTAFDDDYHKGTSSAHAQGLALDFTLADPATSAAVAAQVRSKLQALGVDGKVIDEYANPSSRATAGHIHVQFGSAAQRFSRSPGAGVAANSGSGGGSSTTKTDVHIDTINVTTAATDAPGIARDIGAALRTTSMAVQANTSPH